MSEYPSLPEQGKNLAATAFNIFKGAMMGNPIMASEKVKEQREAICNSCEYKDHKEQKCIQCGCILEWKIPFAMTDCPEHKWDMDQEAFEEYFNNQMKK